MKRKPPNTDYEIGYRKPPLATRFKPGQSGNPQGRGKRSKSGRTLLDEVLNETVVVTEGGVPRAMTKREAVFKALVARALKDPRFTNLLMKIMREYELMKDDEGPVALKLILVDQLPPVDVPKKEP
jgi:hypothetical protein